jgi:hypothetical protein
MDKTCVLESVKHGQHICISVKHGQNMCILNFTYISFFTDLETDCNLYKVLHNIHLIKCHRQQVLINSSC